MFISRRCPPALTYQHKILYVGRDHDLFKFLQDRLAAWDCYVDYCPSLWLAYLFLKSKTDFALCVFDELPEATGAKLEQFARALPHRAGTPMIVVSSVREVR
jgi:DNA-binding response OmpR family regulator